MHNDKVVGYGFGGFSRSLLHKGLFSVVRLMVLPTGIVHFCDTEKSDVP